jgi:hypothetical protein
MMSFPGTSIMFFMTREFGSLVILVKLFPGASILSGIFTELFPGTSTGYIHGIIS